MRWISRQLFFLLGKHFEKAIFLETPHEGEVPKGYTWKVSKFVHKVCDSSREEYLTVKK